MASSSALPPTILNEITELFLDANLARFLSAAGLVMLIYDHILTLPEEITLVWKAPTSYSKCLFLLNRYFVPCTLLVVAFEMSAFQPITLSDDTCRTLIVMSTMIGIVSVAIGNILVLTRVVLLWDNNPMVKKVLTIGFLLSFFTTAGAMAATLTRLSPGFEYSTLVKMCVPTTVSPLLIVVWSSPLVFELLVLGATCWNAIDRPTNGALPLTKALQRDGIQFFLALTTLRAANLGLAATMDPKLTMLLVFFVWSMTTLVLNRSLLSSSRASALDKLRVSISTTPRAASPFGIGLNQLEDWEDYEMMQPEVAQKDIAPSNKLSLPMSHGRMGSNVSDSRWNSSPVPSHHTRNESKSTWFEG